MGASWRKENTRLTDIFLGNLSSRRGQSTDNHTEDESNQPMVNEVLREKEKERMKTIVIPDGDFLLYWLAVVSIAVVYNLWVLIAREAWPELQDKGHVAWFFFDYCCDVIYILDMVAQTRTAYLEHGLLVIDRNKLLRHYVKSWQFKVDLLSLLPTDLFYLLDTNHLHPIVRCPRFLRVYRFHVWYRKVENRTQFPNTFRVFNHIHVLLLGIHWTGSVYFLISIAIAGATSQPDDWIIYSEPLGRNATLAHKYLASFYWSTLTLTTIGDLPPPNNEIEYVVQIVGYLVGIFIFATVVGQVGAVIANRNATRMEFERQVDHAKRYMRRNNVPRQLQLQVLRWYDYTWAKGFSHGQYDVNSLELLPDTHRTELALHANLEILKRVSIFAVCPPEILHDLVLRMQFCICTPGDMVCKMGAIAREMFFISDGLFKVTDDTGRVVATRASGEYFGEIGILNLKGNSFRRTANVQSVGFSELFTLSKDDVVDVLKDYPSVMSMIQEEGMRRLETMKKPQPDGENDSDAHDKAESDVDEDIDHITSGSEASTSGSSLGTTQKPSEDSQTVEQTKATAKQHRVSKASNGPNVHTKVRSSSTHSRHPEVSLNDVFSSLKKAVLEKIDSIAEEAHLIQETTDDNMRERVRTLQQENEVKEATILALEKRIRDLKDAQDKDIRMMEETTRDLREKIRTLEEENKSKNATILAKETRIKELEVLPR